MSATAPMVECGIEDCQNLCQDYENFCDRYRCEFKDEYGDRNCYVHRGGHQRPPGANYCTGGLKHQWLSGCEGLCTAADGRYCLDHQCETDDFEDAVTISGAEYCTAHECTVPGCQEEATSSTLCDKHESQARTEDL